MSTNYTCYLLQCFEFDQNQLTEAKNKAFHRHYFKKLERKAEQHMTSSMWRNRTQQKEIKKVRTTIPPLIVKKRKCVQLMLMNGTLLDFPSSRVIWFG